MASQQALTPAGVVSRSSEMIETEIDGEIVALHVEKGTCYGLNKVGSRVWQLAAAPKSVSEICATLQKEYDVAADQCEKQVLQLLEGLRAEGLIDVVEPGASPLNN